ncbi:MAG: hypothetical protein ABUT20_15915 [Bacteroidota bacterium]
MALKKKLYPLTGKVQHYSWGGYDYIPALLDIINEEKNHTRNTGWELITWQLQKLMQSSSFWIN